MIFPPAEGILLFYTINNPPRKLEAELSRQGSWPKDQAPGPTEQGNKIQMLS